MTDRYISPTGNDTTGNGSIGSPWATIDKFWTTAVAGDTLYCRGGTYTSPPDADTLGGPSGTSVAPITVTNYPGETPNFVNAAVYFDGGVSYHVLDGLTFTGLTAGSSSTLWVGNGKSVVGATNTHHITIRNCSITKGAGSVNTRHGIYLSWRSSDVLIEDCVITGRFSFGGEDRAAAVHIFHAPTSVNMTVRRCILRNWPRGIILWDEAPTPTATGTFEHLTFQGNERHFDARYHAAITVRNNVGSTGHEGPLSGNLYDPFDSTDTTETHNYWDQALNVDGSLQAGSPAIDGATDGSDAGAVPFGADAVVVSPPAASLSLTTYAPSVFAPAVVSPPTSALTLTTFAPTVTVDADVLAVPGTAALVLSTFAPLVSIGANVIIAPPTKALVLTTYVPRVKIGRGFSKIKGGIHSGSSFRGSVTVGE